MSTENRIPVIQIQRASLHDGPGVRTVVYTKGCNLSCAWCHNPESQSFARELVIRESKCIGCRRCIDICPACHSIADDRHLYKREDCIVCGRCADACPNAALSVCGDLMTPDDVLRAVQRDAHYYKQSGGGVTFSGGECLLHPDFLAACLPLCRENGIHTAVETAFCVPYASVERLAAQIDLFIIDIKHMDSHEHRLYTGVGNERILENIARLAKNHPHILFRTPLIPGVNDGYDNLLSTARFVAACPGERRLELLKYNNLGASKYEALGRRARVFADQPQDDAYMETLCTRLNRDIGADTVFYRS